MENETTNPTPETTQGTSGLDPQAVQLTQAVRQVESGGDFTSHGASGEYGAYQFMPETWNSEAPQAGVNTPLQESTPEEQNQVAYNQIKKMKDSGLNVGQIASVWNSGNPNAYQENWTGVNKEGVAYDTPEYAQKVAQTYQAIKNGQPVTADIAGTPKTQDPSGTSSMPTWEKILFGVPLAAGAVALGVASGGTAVPEEVAAAEGVGGTADVAGLASKAINFGKGLIANPTSTILKATGLGALASEGIGAVKGALGFGNNAQTQADETANASTQAGQTEANATNQAEQNQAEESESQNDEASAKAYTQNVETASNAFNESLQGTVAGRKLSQSPEGQNGLQGLSQYGINPNIVNENFSLADNKAEVSNIAAELDEKEQDYHSASGDVGDIEELRAEAKQDVRESGKVPEYEYGKADALIDERINSYKSSMGNAPTLGRGGIGTIRRDGYKSYDRNLSTTTNEVGKALGRAANGHMLKHSSSPELINGIHKEKQKLINGGKVLEHLDGKKAPEKHGALQKLLHGTGEMLGLYLGDKIGGPIGAVIGDMVGKHTIKAVDKRYGKNLFEKPAVQKALSDIKAENPKVYGKIENKLRQYGIRAELKKKEPIPMGGETKEGYKVNNAGEKKAKETKMHVITGQHQPLVPERQLPAGNKPEKAIPLGGKTYHGGFIDISKKKPKVKAIKNHATVGTAKKNPSSMNPKSGKFQKSYNSGLLPQSPKNQ